MSNPPYIDRTDVRELMKNERVLAKEDVTKDKKGKFQIIKKP